MKRYGMFGFDRFASRLDLKVRCGRGFTARSGQCKLRDLGLGSTPRRLRSAQRLLFSISQL